MDLSIQYTQELQSKEGQEILNALKSKMHILEEALDLNNLIPEIRSLSEKDFFKSPILRSELRLINEAEAAELEAAAVSGDEAAIDNVLANSGGLPSPSGGILSMLKSLLSTLTEGGSPIGILHLVLDFIGLVGDAFLV